MREEIYSWMKNLAVFYIVLTAVMNLIPNEKYAGYIRHFTGLLLILLLCSPLFQLLGMDGRMLDNLDAQIRQAQTQILEKGEEEQREYYRKAYEREIAAQIQKYLQTLEYPVLAAEAVLAADGSAVESLTLYLEGERDAAGEEAIRDELEEEYRLGRERVAFCYP